MRLAVEWPELGVWFCGAWLPYAKADIDITTAKEQVSPTELVFDMVGHVESYPIEPVLDSITAIMARSPLACGT